MRSLAWLVVVSACVHAAHLNESILKMMLITAKMGQFI